MKVNEFWSILAILLDVKKLCVWETHVMRGENRYDASPSLWLQRHRLPWQQGHTKGTCAPAVPAAQGLTPKRWLSSAIPGSRRCRHPPLLPPLCFSALFHEAAACSQGVKQAARCSNTMRNLHIWNVRTILRLTSLSWTKQFVDEGVV